MAPLPNTYLQIKLSCSKLLDFFENMRKPSGFPPCLRLCLKGYVWLRIDIILGHVKN